MKRTVLDENIELPSRLRSREAAVARCGGRGGGASVQGPIQGSDDGPEPYRRRKAAVEVLSWRWRTGRRRGRLAGGGDGADAREPSPAVGSARDADQEAGVAALHGRCVAEVRGRPRAARGGAHGGWVREWRRGGSLTFFLVRGRWGWFGFRRSVVWESCAE